MLQDKLDLGALIGGSLADLAMKIVAALLILVVGLWLVKMIVKLVKKGKKFQKLAPEVQTFAASAVKVLGYALVILMAVATVGVPTASILAVLGSCGLAVGLAMQGSLSNLAGGIMLLIFRPFHVGDYISDGAHEGTVKEITLFYTTIATADNLQVTLPNGALANSAIKNLNANKTPPRLCQKERAGSGRPRPRSPGHRHRGRPALLQAQDLVQVRRLLDRVFRAQRGRSEGPHREPAAPRAPAGGSAHGQIKLSHL